MRILKLLVVLFVALACALPANAQLSRKKIKKNNKAMSRYKGSKNGFSKQKRYYSLGFSVNSLSYLGDIAPKARWGSTKLGFMRPGFSVNLDHRFGPRYTLRAALSYGRLQSDDFIVADPNDSDDRFRYLRNASFRNDILDLSVMAVVDLFKNDGSYLSRVPLTPYIQAGASVFHHNPKAKVPQSYVLPADQSTHFEFPNAGEWVALQPLGTEGQNADLQPTDANFGNKPYSLWQFAIPIGLGVRYRLADALDISLDFTFKWLFTDYIDDVSQNYVDLGVLDSDLARAMSNRSRDPLSANGDPRDLSSWTTTTYTGVDGVEYEIVRGFGEEGAGYNRGGASINDVYYVTSFRIAYVIGGKFRRAKFR